MDTLALLCNLHADGPATLQRLRRSGFESIGALRRLDPVRLAETLGWTERAAERFLREAALLRERVDEEELEEAEAPGLEATLLEELDGAAAASEAEDELPGDEPEETEEPPVGTVPHAPAERVQAVLGAWRELDRVTPPSDPADFVIPRPAPPVDEGLARAGLGSLTPVLAERLAQLGVVTLRELLERGELELARAIPLPFTRLCHLRFQAERALEGLVATVPAPAPSLGPRSEFRAFSPPPSEPFETAGPFA